MAGARSKRARRETALDRLLSDERAFLAEYASHLDEEKARPKLKPLSGKTPAETETLLRARRDRLREAFAEMRARQAKRTGIDAMRAQHDPVAIEETMTAGQVVARVETQSAIDRLHRRGLISDRMHAAGERLWMDWYYGGRNPTVVASYQERMDRGVDDRDRAAICSARYREAVKAVSEYLSPILIHVVCLDGMPGTWSINGSVGGQAATALLRVALQMLADYYRIPKEDDDAK